MINYIGNPRASREACDEVQDMLYDLENHPEDYSIRHEAEAVWEIWKDMMPEYYLQIPYMARLILSWWPRKELGLKAISWWIDRWEEEEDAIIEEEAMSHE